MSNDQNVVTTMRNLVNGYQVSQAIHAAATLGIADLLVGAGRTSDELAAQTGTHAPTLYRLLRALASVNVLHETDGSRFELTPLGEQLRSDVPDSIAVGPLSSVDLTTGKRGPILCTVFARARMRSNIYMARTCGATARHILKRARFSTGR